MTVIEGVKIEPDHYRHIAISQATRANGIVFISGQLGIDCGGHLVCRKQPHAQAEQAFVNLGRVLDAAGSAFSHVVKVTIYVTDLHTMFPIVEAMRRKYFVEPYPADTIVSINALAAEGALIEIEAIALQIDAAASTTSAAHAARLRRAAQSP